MYINKQSWKQMHSRIKSKASYNHRQSSIMKAKMISGYTPKPPKKPDNGWTKEEVNSMFEKLKDGINRIVSNIGKWVREFIERFTRAWRAAIDRFNAYLKWKKAIENPQLCLPAPKPILLLPGPTEV